MAEFAEIEIVRIRPKPGTEERLLTLRRELIAQYQALYDGRFSSTLAKMDDHWVDVWVWESRALAEEALSDTSKIPAFEEWITLVEDLSLEWGQILWSD